MTIKKLMMAAGAIDGPQVIAPSSNDWIYTYSQDEWPFAGNSLGDGTSGGFVDNTGGDSGIASLHTFDGDFEIEATYTNVGGLTTAVFEIEDDDGFDAASDGNTTLRTMSNCWSWQSGTGNSWSGHASGSFVHNNTGEGSAVNAANGSVIKWARVDGQITVYDDGSAQRAFTTTSTKPLRFAIVAPGVTTGDIDNILYTDTEKVQRDGIYDESSTTSSALGNYASGSIHIARRWKATRTGTLASLSFNVRTAATPSNFHAELWTDDGTNPVSQVGGVTNTLTINSTGKKTFTFSTEPDVVKGQSYWAVIEDEDHASVNANIALWEQPIAGIPNSGAGLHDTVTSITASKSAVYTMEAVINATEEPTPDHDTLLLIHSDTSDGSTTFADSSQSGRTITVAGNAQHDTAQKPFGASSILFDGTGDYLTVPDSNDWAFSNAFTIDFWMRAAGVGVNQPLIGQWSSGSNSGIAWYIFRHSSNVIEFTFGNGSSSTSAVSTSTLAATTWYHIACVYDGGKMGLWHNGTSQTTTSSTIVTNNLGLVVDIGRDFAGRYFNGHLHEIRISNVARWEPGVAFTPPTSAYP